MPPRKRIGKVTDRRPTKGSGAGCKHKDGLPCFRAVMTDNGQLTSYHWLTEDAAVMFAMRQTRNNHRYIAVFDPESFMVVAFEGRRYVNIRTKSSIKGDIWDQLATEARNRKPKKPLRKPKKTIRKSK